MGRALKEFVMVLPNEEYKFYFPLAEPFLILHQVKVVFMAQVTLFCLRRFHLSQDMGLPSFCLQPQMKGYKVLHTLDMLPAEASTLKVLRVRPSVMRSRVSERAANLLDTYNRSLRGYNVAEKKMLRKEMKSLLKNNTTESDAEDPVYPMANSEVMSSEEKNQVKEMLR